jgi:pimeloyl-ACP methyl ester carboxylesterase
MTTEEFAMGEYLLVHGGLGVGWVWDDVAKRLKTAGHRVHVVDHLPSVGTDPASLGDLSADASHVRQTLDAIDKPIVLVGHSYSGMVITEFADHPKVRHTVYMTAFLPERGQSALNLVGDVLPPVFTQRNDGAFEITNDFEFAWKSFCPDLDRERAHEVLARFVLQSDSSFAAPSTAPGRTHPTTYVIAARETDASVAAQEAWAANADYVVRLPAAHMLQLSRPDELAEALGGI